MKNIILIICLLVAANSFEAFCNDKHLNLIYNPLLAKVLQEDTTSLALNYSNEEAKIELCDNYRFKNLRNLDRNIGYINSAEFLSPAIAGQMADGSLFIDVVPKFCVLSSSVTAYDAKAFVSQLKYQKSKVIIVGKKNIGDINSVAHISINRNFFANPEYKKDILQQS